ncbi:golgin subfamily A member 2-like [Fukomys damarensis]|uniref:golgin subfamily A member 2-like n=1 Tax=Fukomys damarensis TaxID=885580 RepID=UPI00053F2C7B|nr:golgin subfamily A member 2-like [Fukomys damarensis]
MRQNPAGASAGGQGMILHSALPHGQPDWQLGPGCLGGIDSHSPQAEENHQLASALQSEQLEKKALARKLRELQEKLCEITALMALKSQEAQHLQQPGDQLLSQVWQHAESWQQLAMEKEALYRRVLLHRNLARQAKEQQKMVALDRICQEMQEDLKASRLQEEQAAPLRVLALAGAGDMKQWPVEAPGSNTTIPEDSGTSEALEHQAPLPRGLRQQNGQCQCVAHLAALIQDTPVEGAPNPRSSGNRVPNREAAGGGSDQGETGGAGASLSGAP